MVIKKYINGNIFSHPESYCLYQHVIYRYISAVHSLKICYMKNIRWFPPHTVNKQKWLSAIEGEPYLIWGKNHPKMLLVPMLLSLWPYTFMYL